MVSHQKPIQVPSDELRLEITAPSWNVVINLSFYSAHSQLPTLRNLSGLQGLDNFGQAWSIYSARDGSCELYGKGIHTNLEREEKNINRGLFLPFLAPLILIISHFRPLPIHTSLPNPPCQISR